METICIITPAYNEEENLHPLFDKIIKAMDGVDIEWRWLIVDDRSSDDTFGVINELAKIDSRVGGVRLSRRSGSHSAIKCGLQLADQDCVAVIAGDQQDPPEIIPKMIKHWREGSKVVWGERMSREGDGLIYRICAALYHRVTARIEPNFNFPSSGADIFLADRCIFQEVCRMKEANVSIFGLIAWVGFHQTTIPYKRMARVHGQSGWTISATIKLFLDTIVSFSYAPIRFISYSGLFFSLMGFAYALFVTYSALNGSPVEGWPSLMVALLVIGGIQITMLGIIGEYVWRTFDGIKNRPQFLIESRTGFIPAAVSGDRAPDE